MAAYHRRSNTAKGVPGLFVVRFFCIVLCLSVLVAHAYDPDPAIAYAELWYDDCNHECTSLYRECTPWSYWGMDCCGYPSKGGDCANFISQCLIAGGESGFNDTKPNPPCRGFPCGKEEIGANNLGECLKQYHGWREIAYGKREPMPASMKPGDVIVYGKSSGWGTHIALIVRVEDGKAYIAAHSSPQFDRVYTYLTGSSHEYYRWIQAPRTVTSVAAPTVLQSKDEPSAYALYTLDGRKVIADVNLTGFSSQTAHLPRGTYFLCPQGRFAGTARPIVLK
ncbi:MAG: hypothetical protein GF398_06800 [Chitinivibrionales bacterium]|nr:hypothetical protein [Chitinivibrionales bacterium]